MLDSIFIRAGRGDVGDRVVVRPFDRGRGWAGHDLDQHPVVRACPEDLRVLGAAVEPPEVMLQDCPLLESQPGDFVSKAHCLISARICANSDSS